MSRTLTHSLQEYGFNKTFLTIHGANELILRMKPHFLFDVKCSTFSQRTTIKLRYFGATSPELAHGISGGLLYYAPRGLDINTSVSAAASQRVYELAREGIAYISITFPFKNPDFLRNFDETLCDIIARCTRNHIGTLKSKYQGGNHND